MFFYFDIIKNCFNVNLLIYSWRFASFYDFDVFKKSTRSLTISWFWFSKVVYLIKNHKYDYTRLSTSHFIPKTYSLMRFKIIELSFSFLLVSFFKAFLISKLNEWVWLLK